MVSEVFGYLQEIPKIVQVYFRAFPKSSNKKNF